MSYVGLNQRQIHMPSKASVGTKCLNLEIIPRDLLIFEKIYSMFKTVRLLNRPWIILELSHVFSLHAVQKDLSPAALVAGFTKISLHNVITSFIISRSGLGNS